MIQVVEPATAEVMAEVPQAGVEETDAAVARAKEAFPAWRAVSPGDRSALLHRLANALEEKVDELANVRKSSTISCLPSLAKSKNIRRSTGSSPAVSSRPV